MILVNLTCGRNPWKQASVEDSTYRAYTRSRDFLKTILPVSDELNDILGRIFVRNPDQRITLPELRARILACSRFTEPPAAQLPMTPSSPGQEDSATEYVDEEASAMDDQCDSHEAPLSPASSDGESCSSVEDLEEDDYLDDLPEARTPPPQASPAGDPAVFEAEEPRMVLYHHPPQHPHHQHGHHHLPEEYQLHSYAVAVPEPVQAMPVPVQPTCAAKFQLHHYFWDMLRYGQPTPPQLRHPVPFHHQVPLLAQIQGCY